MNYLKAGAAIVMLLAAVSLSASDQITGPVRVVDGDTLVMHERKIRLSGIDAPGAHQNCLDENYQWYPLGDPGTCTANFRKPGILRAESSAGSLRQNTWAHAASVITRLCSLGL